MTGQQFNQGSAEELNGSSLQANMLLLRCRIGVSDGTNQWQLEA